MSEFLFILGALLFCHFLADYPLQGDFLARAKNHVDPIPNVSWRHALFAHSFIHAGFVYLVTGQPLFFFIELIGHAIIDHEKCKGELTFNMDQAIHLSMKVIYALVLIFIL